MNIQYASDLHLEMPANAQWIQKNPIKPKADTLVLAGDIYPFGDDYADNPFWDYVSKNFKRTIVIPGNHELYGHFDINKLRGGSVKAIRDNVHLVYNKVIHLDEKTDLIASTLWSHIPEETAVAVQACVNDFNRIRDGAENLTSDRFNKEFKRCLNFVKRSLKNSKAKNKIVVTHHVPSNELIVPVYRGSLLSGAFVTDLDKVITDLKPNYWIYGHSHGNIDKKIGSTQCLSNQLGYVQGENISSFSTEKVLKI